MLLRDYIEELYSQRKLRKNTLILLNYCLDNLIKSLLDIITDFRMG